MKKVYEYGMKANCEKNGCNPHHSDEDRIFIEPEFFFKGLKPGEALKVNGHIMDIVRRKVTYGDWKPHTLETRD